LRLQGSVVLDAGCGNGKYLPVRSILPVEEDSSKSSLAYLAAGGVAETARVQSLLSVGLDITQGLLEVASKRGHEVVRGDCFDLSCWREGTFVSSPCPIMCQATPSAGSSLEILTLSFDSSRTTPSRSPSFTTSRRRNAAAKLSRCAIPTARRHSPSLLHAGNEFWPGQLIFAFRFVFPSNSSSPSPRPAPPAPPAPSLPPLPRPPLPRPTQARSSSPSGPSSRTPPSSVSAPHAARVAPRRAPSPSPRASRPRTRWRR